MRRREAIGVIGGMAAWPLATSAQQPSQIRRIGVLMAFAEGDPEAQARVAAFQDELRKLGWAGSSLTVHTRWGVDAEARQRSARELMAVRPDVLIAHTTPAVRSLQQETSSTPIVFVGVADPVGSGFVASLSRPGGNLTGFTNIEPTMVGKWVELLKEVAPRCIRVRMLFNRTTAPYAQDFIAPFDAATRSLGMESIVEPLRQASDIEPALASLGQGQHGGLVVLPDVFTTAHRVEIIALATQFRLPAVYPFRYFAELGGLLSYGNDTLDMVRRTATYADRILKGALPGELPIQAPVKFELSINMRTAKALGLDVPSHIQQRADQVIE